MRANHGPLAQLAWAGAAIALGWALQLGNGHLNFDAIPWLTVALVLTAVAVVSPRIPNLGWHPDRIVISVLITGIVFQFWQLLARPPAIYMVDTRYAAIMPFRQGIVLAFFLCCVLASTGKFRTRMAVLALVLGVHFAVGVWQLRASPEPFIDTYFFQKEAAEALLDGRNPYRIKYTNIYPDEAVYGENLFIDHRSRFGFPYPPLFVWFATLGHLFAGDFRYSQLFAVTLAGVLIAAIGSGRRIAVLAAILFLFTPRFFFVLEQSWTEPYIVMLLAAVAFCARRGSRATPWVTGLFLVAKQYMFLAVPLVWLLPRMQSVRSLRAFFTRAAISGALVTLPLVLIRPKPFWRSVVVLQFLQPFRPDSLSYAAYWRAQGADPIPANVVFLTAACAIAVALWRSPRTTAGFVGAVALTYFSFFAFAKQAFCNFYYFVIGALCCAIAAATHHDPDFEASYETRRDA